VLTERQTNPGMREGRPLTTDEIKNNGCHFTRSEVEEQREVTMMRPCLVVAAGFVAVSVTVAGNADVNPTRLPTFRTEAHQREVPHPQRDHQGSAARRNRAQKVPARAVKPRRPPLGVISSPEFPPEIWMKEPPGR
jgi:hypothetical protein